MSIFKFLKFAKGSKAALAFWSTLGIILVGGGVAIFFNNISFISKDIQYDAISAWQSKDDSGFWDIAYSIYSSSKNRWFDKIYTFSEFKNANSVGLIKLKGQDQDPDISSTKSYAVVVWSNDGADGNEGADIYYSFWSKENNFKFDSPKRLFPLKGDDVDPTVFLASPKNALLVWVNKNQNGDKLYFSEYRDGKWSQPSLINLKYNIQRISSPELTFNEKSRKYILSFTAKSNNGELPFFGVYSGKKWVIFPVKSNFPAMVDASVPNKYKTSVNFSENKLAFSYTGKDNSLWVYVIDLANRKINSPKRISSEAVSPSVLMQKSKMRIIYSEPRSLSDIDVAGENKIFISRSENGYVRSDAVNLFEESNLESIAVWDSRDNKGKSNILFSVYKNKWSSPKSISDNLNGNNLVPAVTPIFVVVNKKEEIVTGQELPFFDEFCGDGVINSFFEECEIGVACKSKDAICDWELYSNVFGKLIAALASDCECIYFPDGEKDGVKSPEKKKDSSNEGLKVNESSIIGKYGGPACGFDTITISREVDIAGDRQLEVFFSPASASGEREMFSNIGKNKWSVVNNTGTMKIFPGADPKSQPDAAVILEINKDIIKIQGIQPSGFVLCTGEFIKGKESNFGGKLLPAPAPAPTSIPFP